MAFESLTERLQNVFKNLRKKGKISESDVTFLLIEQFANTLFVESASGDLDRIYASYVL